MVPGRGTYGTEVAAGAGFEVCVVAAFTGAAADGFTTHRGPKGGQ